MIRSMFIIQVGQRAEGLGPRVQGFRALGVSASGFRELRTCLYLGIQ